MSTNFTRKRMYFLQEGEDNFGESINDIVSAFPQMKRDLQACLDALILLQERLHLIPPSSSTNTTGSGSGTDPGTLVPPTPQLTTVWSTTDPTKLDITWQPISAAVGLTGADLSIDDVPVLRLTFDVDAPKWSVFKYLPTNPLVRSVKVSLTLLNAIGPSNKTTIYVDYIFPPPLINPNLQTVSSNPTIVRFTWDPPVNGPPALGYAVYADGINQGETSNVAPYMYWNVQPNPIPNAPARLFEVKALFTLPESIYTSSAASILIQ
jgi:hypothetical protein